VVWLRLQQNDAALATVWTTPANPFRFRENFCFRKSFCKDSIFVFSKPSAKNEILKYHPPVFRIWMHIQLVPESGSSFRMEIRKQKFSFQPYPALEPNYMKRLRNDDCRNADYRNSDYRYCKADYRNADYCNADYRNAGLEPHDMHDWSRMKIGGWHTGAA
jgi:hypothetical protein